MSDRSDFEALFNRVGVPYESEQLRLTIENGVAFAFYLDGRYAGLELSEAIRTDHNASLVTTFIRPHQRS